MSPTPASRPGAGAYLRPLALIAFGGMAWGLTTGMTMQAHRIASLTAAGENLGSGAALFIDAMVVLLAGCAGLLLKKGHRAIAGGVGLCLFIFTVYSMASVAGFGAAERIAKYQTNTHNLDSGATAVKERNIAVRRDRDRAIAFLEAQIKNERREGYRGELLTSMQKLLAQPLPQEVWRADTIMADPEAEMFADLAGRLGLDVRGFQVGKAVTLGILLVLGKVLCFSLATLLWPLKMVVPPTKIVVEAPKSIAPPPPTSVNPEPPETRPPGTKLLMTINPSEKAPQLPLAAAAAPVAEPANNNAPARRSAELALVKEFLEAAQTTAGSKDARRMKATTVYFWFREFCKERRVPVMTSSLFGRCVTELKDELGIRREKHGSYVFFFGLAKPITNFVAVNTARRMAA